MFRRFRSVYPHVLKALPAPLRTRIVFAQCHGRWPNLRTPTTFNEKVAWRKLYDDDPRIPLYLDKIAVKDIIAERFGQGLLIPTLAIYDSPAEMDFATWPLSTPPYVIKANHGCAMNIFVRDSEFEPDSIKAQLAHWLATDYSSVADEKAYSRIKPRILVEEFLGPSYTVPADYKFHVFTGKAYMIEYIQDRLGRATHDFYTPKWKRLDLMWGFCCAAETEKPDLLDEMIKIAELIGREFDYLRVDLYLASGQIKFGEMTFFPGAGNDPFNPREWDAHLGKLWPWPPRN